MSQEMPKKAEFEIAYDGPALELSEMEVKELAPALLALSDLIEEANKIINGDKIKVLVNVKGSFKRGSFLTLISVHQNLLNQILGLFETHTVEGVINLLTLLGFACTGAATPIKGLLHVIKWLKKRKINEIQPLKNGNIKLIVDNEEIEVVPAILTLLENYKIRQSLERLITKPLEKPGIDLFAVKTNEKELFIINKQESSYFECPPLQEEELQDITYFANLQIATLAFQDGNKWKVTDGSTPFYATMEDHSFLAKINNNEIAFSKGDILEAKIRKHVWLDIDGNMKAEYTILEIMKHKSAARQLKLL